MLQSRKQRQPPLPLGEVVQLHMPAGALLGKGKKDLLKIRGALVRFVIDTAPTVEIRNYGSYIGDIPPITLPDVPFPLGSIVSARSRHHSIS